MLVLGRQVGQAIKIGKDVEIFVMRLKGKDVRIGIVAPPEVKILRAELPEAIDSDRPE